jgi:non-ribosomal peptide synthetase component E (peptide arylation enzyme)
MPIIDRIGAATRRRWAADGLYDDLDLYTAFHRQAHQRPEQLAVIDARSALGMCELWPSPRARNCASARHGVHGDCRRT